MARVTVEDAVNKIGNRFDMILVAARRAQPGHRQVPTRTRDRGGGRGGRGYMDGGGRGKGTTACA